MERTAAQISRIFSICFCGRFVVPFTIVAATLITDGAIGTTVGFYT